MRCLSLGRRTEAVVRLNRVDAERRADAPGREDSGGRLDHPIGLDLRQFDALVMDADDLELVLQQIGEEFLAGHWIVGEVMLVRRVCPERDPVFDVVFCEHGDVPVDVCVE